MSHLMRVDGDGTHHTSFKQVSSVILPITSDGGTYMLQNGT